MFVDKHHKYVKGTYDGITKQIKWEVLIYDCWLYEQATTLDPMFIFGFKSLNKCVIVKFTELQHPAQDLDQYKD